MAKSKVPTIGPSQGGGSLALVRRCCLLVALSITMGWLAVPADGAGSRGTGANGQTPIQQGLAFYKGKTITYIVPGAPGGSPDTLTRIMAPNLGAYLHATVNIVDVNLSQQAEDQIAAARPDGLTVGLMNLGPAAVNELNGTPIVNFNPEREQYIGAPSANVDVYVVGTKSPIKSWAQAVASTTPLTELGIENGTDTTLTVLADAAFGIKYQLITGYSNEGALTQGLLRGDGDLILGPVSALGPLVTAGQAIPIALNTPLTPGSSYAATLGGVPTTAQLLKRFPPKTRAEKQAAAILQTMGPLGAFATFVPSKTPSARTDALRAAMKWAQARPAAVQQAASLGLGTGFQSGTEVKQRYIQLVQLLKPLAATLSKEIA